MKWTTKSLGEIADFCLGKMLDGNKNRGEPLPYLANLNVRWGEFDLENLREMRFEEDEMDRYGLKYGDIVMCEGGEPGRCAIWKEPVPGMMIQKALHRIRPHKCLDHRFLFYSFLHKGRTGSFSPMMTGATIKHLPRQQLAKIEVQFPQLEVQRHIADVLSGYDDLMENNQRRVTLLEESVQQLYREWFVRLRFPGHERTAFLDGIPEGWTRATVGEYIERDVIELQTGPFGTQLRASDYTDSGTPVINVRNIGYGSLRSDKIEFVPEAIAQRLGVHILQNGDIVFGRKGAVDRHLLISTLQAGWMQGSDCIRLRILSDAVCPIFLSFAFREEGHKRWMLTQCSSKATMASLNQDVISRISILSPSRPLLRVFREFSSCILSQIATLQRQTEKAAQARDLLLPRLMRGEIAA
jgi:type I restriction enzyme, S subunit